jgi:hypothetical protein
LARSASDGLVTLNEAAVYTGRTRKSLQRRYERGQLQAVSEVGPRGERLFLFIQFAPLIDEELLAA